MAEQDRIRVLRLVEYEGPRDLVEKQIARFIHGIRFGFRDTTDAVRITAVTLGLFPEIVEEARAIPAPGVVAELQKALDDKTELARQFQKRSYELEEQVRILSET